jgi:Rieske Fe-S protein
MDRIEINGVGCASCAEKAGTSRREFITTSAASAVAALLVAACGGASGATGIGGPVSLSVQVSSYAALANVGGIARVDTGGTPVAAIRTGATTFAALSLICPHFGCTVGINGRAFLCPCHGAQFASTGNWIGGQPTTNLSRLSTSYNATTGVLTITG